MKGIFQKKFSNFGFDIINILSGVEKADPVFQVRLHPSSSPHLLFFS